MTKEKLKGKPEKLAELYFPDGESTKVVNDLVESVIKSCSYRFKVKATLLQIYHHAIHNRYYEAKDLLIKSKIHSSISK